MGSRGQTGFGWWLWDERGGLFCRVQPPVCYFCGLLQPELFKRVLERSWIILWSPTHTHHQTSYMSEWIRQDMVPVQVPLSNTSYLWLCVWMVYCLSCLSVLCMCMVNNASYYFLLNHWQDFLAFMTTLHCHWHIYQAYFDRYTVEGAEYFTLSLPLRRFSDKYDETLHGHLSFLAMHVFTVTQ